MSSGTSFCHPERRRRIFPVCPYHNPEVLPCSSGLWPTEEHRYGDIEEVWVDNDSKVCMHFEDYDGYNIRGSLLVWDNKAGGFVMSADLPHENDMEIFMTGNGDLIFSSYNGVRKVDIPDIQTLIDQTRTR